MVNTNVTVYLLHRIVNLTPAEHSIETDLAATENFISALARFQTAAAVLDSMRREINSEDRATTQFTCCSPGHANEVS